LQKQHIVHNQDKITAVQALVGFFVSF